MRRMTILAVMCGVGMVAVGLAALRNADMVWQAVTVTLTLGILGIAALGVVQRRGRERAWWLGFSLFGWGYLLLSQGPWISDHVEPMLLTSQALRYVRGLTFGNPTLLDRKSDLVRVQDALAERRDMLLMRGFDGDSTVYTLSARVKTLEAEIQKMETAESPMSRRWRAMLPGATNSSEYFRIGHYLCALAAALIGAMTSKGFHVERDRTPDSPQGVGSSHRQTDLGAASPSL